MTELDAYLTQVRRAEILAHEREDCGHLIAMWLCDAIQGAYVFGDMGLATETLAAKLDKIAPLGLAVR